MIRRVDFNSGLWHEIWQLDLQWVQGDICHFFVAISQLVATTTTTATSNNNNNNTITAQKAIPLSKFSMGQLCQICPMLHIPSAGLEPTKRNELRRTFRICSEWRMAPSRWASSWSSSWSSSFSSSTTTISKQQQETWIRHSIVEERSAFWWGAVSRHYLHYTDAQEEPLLVRNNNNYNNNSDNNNL